MSLSPAWPSSQNHGHPDIPVARPALATYNRAALSSRAEVIHAEDNALAGVGSRLSLCHGHDARAPISECLEHACFACSGLHPEMLFERLARDHTLDVATSERQHKDHGSSVR
jgi:hypothetical protein